MNEQLLKRICVEMLDKNGNNCEYMYQMPHFEMVEEMRDPENFVEFLSLFGDTIGIADCLCNKCINHCFKTGNNECLRLRLRRITSDKKYNIIITQQAGINHKVRTVLPGTFTKEHAQKIIDAYNSPDYTMEEIK